MPAGTALRDGAKLAQLSEPDILIDLLMNLKTGKSNTIINETSRRYDVHVIIIPGTMLDKL